MSRHNAERHLPCGRNRREIIFRIECVPVVVECGRGYVLVLHLAECPLVDYSIVSRSFEQTGREPWVKNEPSAECYTPRLNGFDHTLI